MAKYIIIYTQLQKEEVEFDSMSEAEDYATSKNTSENRWSSITLINYNSKIEDLK